MALFKVTNIPDFAKGCGTTSHVGGDHHSVVLRCECLTGSAGSLISEVVSLGATASGSALGPQLFQRQRWGYHSLICASFRRNHWAASLLPKPAHRKEDREKPQRKVGGYFPYGSSPRHQRKEHQWEHRACGW